MDIHARIVSTLTDGQQVRLHHGRYAREMTSLRELTTPNERVAWAIEKMKASGVGLEELALKVGCTHATLSQWQTGQTNIENAKVGLVDAFCKATGVSLEWLLHGGPVRIESYISSERVAELTQKLVAMESIDPNAFGMAAKMIDAVAPPDGPTPH